MIELRKLQLREIYDFVNRLQLNKVTDAKVRKTVLKLILELPKTIDGLQKDVDETRNKILGEFKQEDLQEFQKGINEIDELIRNNKHAESMEKDKELSEKYPEITKAYGMFIASVNDLYGEKVELNIDKINTDDFVEAMIGQDVTISGQQINLLAPIFNDESED